MKLLAGRMTSSPGCSPERAQGYLKGVGSARDADDVLDTDELGVGLLELGDLLATDERGAGDDIGQPAFDLVGDFGVGGLQIDEGDRGGRVVGSSRSSVMIASFRELCSYA